MPRTASKIVPKPSRKVRSGTKPAKPVPVSADDALAEHLKQAEHHLIEAVNLFSGPKKPDRRVEYLQRLNRAQEAITGLYREELVRIRGPIKKRGTK
jgi:hypothetical protein